MPRLVIFKLFSFWDGPRAEYDRLLFILLLIIILRTDSEGKDLCSFSQPMLPNTFLSFSLL